MLFIQFFFQHIFAHTYTDKQEVEMSQTADNCLFNDILMTAYCTAELVIDIVHHSQLNKRYKFRKTGINTNQGQTSGNKLF